MATTSDAARRRQSAQPDGLRRRGPAPASLLLDVPVPLVRHRRRSLSLARGARNAAHAGLRDALLIFVKEPVPGQVKTRLAAEIGTMAACHVYRRCVERTLERLAVLRDEIALYVEPAEATGRIQTWLGPAWPVHPQRGATLGERLADATDRAFAEGMHRVILIGTDSPWIDHLRVEEAFSAMDRTDLVLGPAADGGYYLLGLAKPAPELFRGILWSTGQVLNQTLAAARRLGLVASPLHPGYDIDRLEDVRRWMDSDPCHGVTVPIPAACGVTRTARRMSHA